MENRVGFGRRLGAHVLDFVIVLVLAFLARGLVGALFPDALQSAVAEQMNKPGMDGEKMAAARGWIEGSTKVSIAAIILWVLYGLSEALTGRTPAKVMLGIQVVDESGQRAPVGKLLLRYLVKYSGSVLALVGFLAGSSMLSSAGQIVSLGISVGCFLVFARARQALHDKIAGTAVLRRSDVAATTPAPSPAAVA